MANSIQKNALSRAQKVTDTDDGVEPLPLEAIEPCDPGDWDDEGSPVRLQDILRAAAARVADDAGEQTVFWEPDSEEVQKLHALMDARQQKNSSAPPAPEGGILESLLGWLRRIAA